MMSIIETSSLTSGELDPDGVVTCPLHDAELISDVRKYIGISTHYGPCVRITESRAAEMQACLQHHFGREHASVSQVWNNPGLYEIYVRFRF